MNRGRSWNEDDGDNLLLSRPTPQSRDMSLPPPLLNSRQASQNDLDIFNRASGANPSQQSRISGERSSGSNSGSAVSNYGGGLSGTGTAATSVSGDLNTPRKSLSQNRPTFSSTVGGLKSASEVSLPIESRASSELDHSFNSFARPGTFRTSNQQGLGSASAQRNGEPAGRSSTSSDGRRSLDRLKEFSAARVASSISSEDDADDDEGSERENPAKRQARRAARRKVRGAGVEGSEEEIMAGSSQQGSDPHSRFQRPLRRITSRNNGFTPLTLSLLHLRFGPRTLKIQLSPLVLNKVRILPVLLLPRRKPPYLRSLIYEARHQHNLQCREEPVWELQDLARSQSWEQVLETEAQVAPLPQSLLAVAERRRKWRW